MDEHKHSLLNIYCLPARPPGTLPCPPCRNAQMAGRASVELHTLIFFRSRQVVADARVTKASGRWGQSIAGVALPVWLPGGGGKRCTSARACFPLPACATNDHAPACCLPCPAQVRANGLIVFVPKYGIEGPVYLEDSAAAAAAADGPAPSSGGRKKGAALAPAAAADSLYVYDEEKQTVRSKDGSTHYTMFDKCAVRCAAVRVGGWWCCAWLCGRLPGLLHCCAMLGDDRVMIASL